MTQEFDIEDSWIDILLSLLPEKSERIKGPYLHGIHEE